jgi:putative tryptophan/tyrosine transport system substrate-binding protein
MELDQLKRRDLITLLGGAAIAWPLVARAQQAAMPVIGYIDAGSPEPAAHLVSAFLRGLGETGFVEGRNVAIEFRWAHNNNERLPEFAADLVRRRVAVIVAPQSTAAEIRECSYDCVACIIKRLIAWQCCHCQRRNVFGLP